MEATTKLKRAAAPRRLVRDKPEDFVADWFFPISMPAFQAAIDVERTERRKPRKSLHGEKLPPLIWYVWSQRARPDWAFVEGDVFHAPPIAPGPWREQATGLRWTVQIKRLLDRTATVVVTEYREARTSVLDVSMDDLATLLRTGFLDGRFDFAAALPLDRGDHVE
ncbi:hypothetical protein D3273_26670 [Lichenibacterium minor]|uniref:Uncharacterized protein n=1 Tax=Lichenibacterium minor TaxID=2316528 RepID=A0A4Q2TZZ2_9HYPH|nr:hypothetical protein [Lichenibacterium minor]RYC28928.1 hypothetical protein D3273_26670 [Lichenibacterium minor]